MIEFVTWPRSRWSVFDELESLQADLSRMMSGGESAAAEAPSGRRVRSWRRGRPSYPLMNVWSSADGIVIDAELPGIDPKKVEILAMGDELTLRGMVGTAEDDENETYHRRERPAGEFARTLQLPFRADSSAVTANYKNGILRVSVPRPEEEKPKRIAVETA